MTLEELVAGLTDEQIQAICEHFPADLDNAELVQNFVCDLGKHLEIEAYGRGFYLHSSKAEGDAIAAIAKLVNAWAESRSNPE